MDISTEEIKRVIVDQREEEKKYKDKVIKFIPLWRWLCSG